MQVDSPIEEHVVMPQRGPRIPFIHRLIYE